MSDGGCADGAGAGRRLESPDSQAAGTPAARHDDALSPSRALAESVNAEGSQRVGSSPPLANPVTSFPDRATDEPGEAGEPDAGTGRGSPEEEERC
jgi:hypothetical protein